MVKVLKYKHFPKNLMKVFLINAKEADKSFRGRIPPVKNSCKKLNVGNGCK